MFDRVAGSVSGILCGLMAACMASGVLPAADQQQGSLVIVGGGPLTDDIVERFVELAGGSDARLVVIPTASADTGNEKAKATVELWRGRGIGTTTLLHTRDTGRANDDTFTAPLKAATAVWISGGQQSRLAAAYVGTKVQAELHALLKRGGVVGGTSAGAAIQSGVMIESGNPAPKIGRGFDLLPNTIIDQHFLRRSRANRLIEAISQHPDRLGIGIDESTALIVHADRAKVVGASYVTLITVPKFGRPVAVRTLRNGAEFDLPGVTKSTP